MNNTEECLMNSTEEMQKYDVMNSTEECVMNSNEF
jgi:hypothetical protein